jgi:engulfment/cell motility protein 1
MWHESESRLDDFSRVSLLVRSQVELSLTDEASKTWLHLEKDFLDADYKSIRDRQMEQLEKEDGMLSRPSVTELRHKLGREAYELMSEQR